jgi:hypothetical protein
MPDYKAWHILLVVYLLLLGGGTYITYVQQGGTLDALDRSMNTTQQRWDELTALRKTATRLAREASQGPSMRRERYKQVPDTMSTARMMSDLTALTRTGFDAFDLKTGGRYETAGVRAVAMTAEGRASFGRLYRFVWTLENHRPFYRIRDLQIATLDQRSTDEETGRTTMDILVSFRMDVEAIYGGRSPTETTVGTDEQQGVSLSGIDSPPPVPDRVLPASEPSVNPFYPLVFKQIPPNEHGRLNVETARFLSIIGREAVFETDQCMARFGVGDRVYLGRIVDVDPTRGRVVARLDKGGIVDRVERTLEVPSSAP